MLPVSRVMKCYGPAYSPINNAFRIIHLLLYFYFYCTHSAFLLQNVTTRVRHNLCPLPSLDHAINIHKMLYRLCASAGQPKLFTLDFPQ